MEEFTARLARLGRSALGLEAPTLAPMLEAIAPHVAAFGPGDVASAARSLAVLQIAPPPAWREALRAAAGDTAGRMSPAQLADCLFGLSRLPPPGPAGPMPAGLVAATRAALPELSPRQLAAALHALATVGQPADAGFASAAVAAVAAALPGCTGADLGLLAAALPALGAAPPGRAWHGAFRTAVLENLPLLQFEDAARVAEGLVALRAPPDATFAAQLELAATAVHQYQGLGPAPPPAFAALCAALAGEGAADAPAPGREGGGGGE